MKKIARRMRIDMPHPLAGSVPQVPSPMKLSGTPLDPTRPPPLLGEHTLQVLKDRLHINESQAKQLAADGVIQSGPCPRPVRSDNRT